MRKPVYSGQFKRDIKQARKRGKDMDKLNTLLNVLIDGDPLPSAYSDHPYERRLGRFSRCAYRAGLVADIQDIRGNCTVRAHRASC